MGVPLDHLKRLPPPKLLNRQGIDASHRRSTGSSVTQIAEVKASKFCGPLAYANSTPAPGTTFLSVRIDIPPVLLLPMPYARLSRITSALTVGNWPEYAAGRCRDTLQGSQCLAEKEALTGSA